MVVGKNLGRFGKSGAIHQSFAHPNLYHKTACRLKITTMNECQANSRISRGTCMAKGQFTIQSPQYSLCSYLLDYWFFFTKKLYPVSPIYASLKYKNLIPVNKSL